MTTIITRRNFLRGAFATPAIIAYDRLMPVKLWKPLPPHCDPILMGLIRQVNPTLIAHDICGVSPVAAPSKTIIALRAKYVGKYISTEWVQKNILKMTDDEIYEANLLLIPEYQQSQDENTSSLVAQSLLDVF